MPLPLFPSLLARLAPTALVASALLAASTPAASQCPTWLDGFRAPGTGGPVDAFAEFVDAQGQAVLALGGHRLTAPELAPIGGPVVTWDGTQLAALGALDPATSIEDLIVWDDGTGPSLYAAGTFVGGLLHGVARWDGSTWQPLAGGLTDVVHDLEVYDDGTGSALYAAGRFSFAGDGGTLRHVARWNGSAWSTVVNGMLTGPNGEVHALAVWNDGVSTKLFAGGTFTRYGQSPAHIANNLARWNGTGWSALSNGVIGAPVRAFAAFDDGSGEQLYVGGDFTSSAGLPMRGIGRFNGVSWSSVGAGLGTGNARVHALTTGDVGQGPRLFATGDNFAGGTAEWDGSLWTVLTIESNQGDALAVHDDGAGSALYVGGAFAAAGGVRAHGLARWHGAAWSAVPSGLGGFPVTDALMHDDGSGLALHVANGLGFDGAVGRWNGTSWIRVGDLTGYCTALVIHDDGAAAALYAGGELHWPDGRHASIARWDGVAWTAVGLAGWDVFDGEIRDLASHDDGTGPALYACGIFDRVDGLPASRIARWSGGAWSALGSGLDNTGETLAAHDDGTGAALYVGGLFDTAGGVAARRIARWDGSQWSGVGGGVDSGAESSAVFALHPVDDGSGTKLVVGGDFVMAGGAVAENLAVWDGATFAAFAPGATSGASILTCATFDAGLGRGPELHVGGDFDTIGGIAAHGVARWDGGSWQPVGGGVDSAPGEPAYVTALRPGDLGRGASLIAGGRFASAGETYSSGVAVWSACDEVGRTYCHGDGSASACPCGNVSAPGAREGCATFSGVGGRLRASGSASLANDTLALDGTQMNNDAGALYFQGTNAVLGGAGTPFGNGLRCAGGTVMRLAVVSNVAGTSHYPRAGDPPVATQGAVAQPGRRYYQTWFRDAAAFCTTAAFNLTNAVEIVWAP